MKKKTRSRSRAPGDRLAICFGGGRGGEPEPSHRKAVRHSRFGDLKTRLASRS